MTAEDLASWVRLTARLSAVVFSGALFAHARPRVFTPLLASAVVVHTVHFAFVLALAAATDAANIAERGGWLAVTLVAVLFYAGMLLPLRGAWSRRGDQAWRPPRELLALLLPASFFAVSYFGRARSSWMYLGLELMVLSAAATLLVGLFRSSRLRAQDLRRRLLGGSS